MKILSESWPGQGWCSTMRDINGFHIRGPYADPWVGHLSGHHGLCNHLLFRDMSESAANLVTLTELDGRKKYSYVVIFVFLLHMK